MKENQYLDFIIKLLPSFIGVLAILLIEQELSITNVLLSTTLGFSITIWYMVWKNTLRSKEILKNNDKLQELSLVPLVSFEEIEKQVKSLYGSHDAVIYASSINYRPKDISYSDYRKSDWAKNLYAKTGANTQFNRIISVQEQEDKDWVNKMLEINQNDNYDIRIAQNVPSDLLYPNFIIVKSRDEHFRLFISYRANASGGMFSFFTQHKTLCKGIWDYATGFHKDLPKPDGLGFN